MTAPNPAPSTNSPRADESHAKFLCRVGVLAWNSWRDANPEITPYLRYADLSGADLSYADLSYANLSGADLSYANLRGANLRDANLSVANLSDANLRYAHLNGANLIGAHLSGAHLSGANLSDANLRYAHLNGANLIGANLIGAHLNDATTLPTGETWEMYCREVVPALCTAGGASLADVADAWDCHEWSNCPMHVAFGANGISQVPPLHRPRAEQFVQLFDARLIPRPVVTEEPAS